MLDELVNTIESLKARIKEHREHIQGSEKRTRTTLIDPLLYSLGWDVSDPSVVAIEPKTDDGWADYALLDDKGRTVVFVEAKRLSDSNHHIKAGSGVRSVREHAGHLLRPLLRLPPMETYGSCTTSLTQKPVLRTSIMSDETAKCALQLLGLWRSSMADRRLQRAVEPVVDIEPPPEPKPPTPPLRLRHRLLPAGRH